MYIKKILIAVALVAARFTAPAGEYRALPEPDWNDRVTRCALGGKSEIETEMTRLNPARQAMFARDVIRAVSSFPAPRAKTIRRIAAAVTDLVRCSPEDVSRFIEMMAMDGVPADMKQDVALIMKDMRAEPRVRHILPNAYGGVEQAMSDIRLISTNGAYKVDRTVSDNMQSDIGVLRIPRWPGPSRRRDG